MFRQCLLLCLDEHAGTATELHPEDYAIRSRLKQMDHQQAVCFIAAEVASGLYFAHCHDVLHRDVKPANILLNAVGRPLLVDFNLAEEVNDASGGQGMIGGTLAYMSPEHLEAYENSKDAVVQMGSARTRASDENRSSERTDSGIVCVRSDVVQSVVVAGLPGRRRDCRSAFPQSDSNGPLQICHRGNCSTQVTPRTRMLQIAAFGWIPGIVVFPIGLWMLVDANPTTAFIHFTLNFVTSASLAMTYSYLGLTWFVTSVCWLRHWEFPSGFDSGAVSQELGRFFGGLKRASLAVAIVPLLSCMLLIATTVFDGSSCYSSCLGWLGRCSQTESPSGSLRD